MSYSVQSDPRAIGYVARAGQKIEAAVADLHAAERDGEDDDIYQMRTLLQEALLRLRAWRSEARA